MPWHVNREDLKPLQVESRSRGHASAAQVAFAIWRHGDDRNIASHSIQSKHCEQLQDGVVLFENGAEDNSLRPEAPNIGIGVRQPGEHDVVPAALEQALER